MCRKHFSLFLLTFLLVFLSQVKGMAFAGGGAALPLHTGDINNDGVKDEADIECITQSVFASMQGKDQPACQVFSNELIDMDCDDEIDVVDLMLVNYQVKAETDENYAKRLDAVTATLLKIHPGCLPELSENNDKHYQDLKNLVVITEDQEEGLSEDQKASVNGWNEIESNKFECSSLVATDLNFVFIPLGYDFDSDSEAIENFKVYSQWAIWSIQQFEPFKSYGSKIKSWYYLPSVKVEALVEIDWDDQGSKEITAGENEFKITEQMLFSQKEIEVLCPQSLEPKMEGGLFSSVVYVYVINDPMSSGWRVYFTSQGASASFSSGTMSLYDKGISATLESVASTFSVITHELGHTYGGFLDEYSPYDKVNGFDDEQYYLNDPAIPYTRFSFSKAPTCLSLQQAKLAWQDSIDNEVGMDVLEDLKIGYFEGCGHWSNRYRSSYLSIMSIGPGFDAVQREYLCQVLGENTGEYLGECAFF